MDLRQIGMGRGCGMDWTSSVQGPVVGCCECGNKPLGSCATELVDPWLTSIAFTDKDLF
jgi:hypothetical protein